MPANSATTGLRLCGRAYSFLLSIECVAVRSCCGSLAWSVQSCRGLPCLLWLAAVLRSSAVEPALTASCFLLCPPIPSLQSPPPSAPLFPCPDRLRSAPHAAEKSNHAIAPAHHAAAFSLIPRAAQEGLRWLLHRRWTARRGGRGLVVASSAHALQPNPMALPHPHPAHHAQPQQTAAERRRSSAHTMRVQHNDNATQ